MNEKIDFNKAFKLTVGAPLMDKKGNVFEPKIYQPGEIPQELMKPIYGHNIDADEDKKKPEAKIEDTKRGVNPAA